MKLHCLFEQSGTFKTEAMKLGVCSFDYDIRDDFNQTDYKVDLFLEINKAYEGKESIFKWIMKDDYVIAFFPCIRFSKDIIPHLLGTANGMQNWSLEDKLHKAIRLHSELNDYYILISKLVLIALKQGFRLIIENPYSAHHYLTRYWPVKAQFIETDRNKYGDYYQKATQFFFINCEPRFNLVLEDGCIYKRRRIDKVRSVDRSMISPEYANRFIREMILPREE